MQVILDRAVERKVSCVICHQIISTNIVRYCINVRRKTKQAGLIFDS